MLGTFPLLSLILGMATVFSYPDNHGGLVRRMKRSTSQSSEFPQDGGGNPPQDVILTYLKTSRSAIKPSCWFQYYTRCSRSSWLHQGQAEVAAPLSAAGRDSWQPVVVPAPLGSHPQRPTYRQLVYLPG